MDGVIVRVCVMTDGSIEAGELVETGDAAVDIVFVTRTIDWVTGMLVVEDDDGGRVAS